MIYFKRLVVIALVLIISLSAVVACQGEKAVNNNDQSSGGVIEESKEEQVQLERQKLVFGVAPGPYGDMILQGIKPGLEKKGYQISLKEFSDYVQPNLALASGDLDANMFQHKLYLDKFSEDHNLDLIDIIRIPTAAVGLYSNKVDKLEDLPEGAEITIANDATNLARALRILQANDLIVINPDINPTQASEKDIVSNPKKFKITPIEAAQLPRSLDSVDLSAVNGNFAIAAGIPLSSAIAMEVLVEDMKNLIAVRTEDKDAQFVKDIIEIVESEEFKNVIEGSDMFRYFQKPDWYNAKWGN